MDSKENNKISREDAIRRIKEDFQNRNWEEEFEGLKSKYEEINESNFEKDKHFYYIIRLLLYYKNHGCLDLPLINPDENIYFDYINKFFNNITEGYSPNIHEIELEFNLYKAIQNKEYTEDVVKMFFVIKKLCEVGLEGFDDKCILEVVSIINKYAGQDTRGNIGILVKDINDEFYKNSKSQSFTIAWNSEGESVIVEGFNPEEYINKEYQNKLNELYLKEYYDYFGR